MGFSKRFADSAIWSNFLLIPQLSYLTLKKPTGLSVTQFPASKIEEIRELHSGVCLLPICSSLPKEARYGDFMCVFQLLWVMLGCLSLGYWWQVCGHKPNRAEAGKSWLKGTPLQSFAICVWVRALIFVFFHPLLEVSGAVYLYSSEHAGTLISARPRC